MLDAEYLITYSLCSRFVVITVIHGFNFTYPTLLGTYVGKCQINLHIFQELCTLTSFRQLSVYRIQMKYHAV